MFEKFKLKRKIKKLEKEVENNNAQAMYDLAMIYLDGSVIRSDKEKANDLLKQAAELGHIQAKTYLISKKVSKGVDIVTKAYSDIKKLKNK